MAKRRSDLGGLPRLALALQLDQGVRQPRIDCCNFVFSLDFPCFHIDTQQNTALGGECFNQGLQVAHLGLGHAANLNL